MSLNRATTTMHSLTTKTRLLGLGLLLAGSHDRGAERARGDVVRGQDIFDELLDDAGWRPRRPIERAIHDELPIPSGTRSPMSSRTSLSACRQECSRKSTGGAAVHRTRTSRQRSTLPGRCPGRHPQRLVRNVANGIGTTTTAATFAPTTPSTARAWVRATNSATRCRSTGRRPDRDQLRRLPHDLREELDACDTGPGRPGREHATVLSVDISGDTITALTGGPRGSRRVGQTHRCPPASTYCPLSGMFYATCQR